MNVREIGVGPAVVLIQGAPSTPAYFAELAAALANRRRVLIPDLPGYGATPPLEGPYSLARVQQLLEEELLRRGAARCAILGYSGGAYRALSLALSSRIETTALYLLSGFAGLPPEGRAGLREYAKLLRNPSTDIHPIWRSVMISDRLTERNRAGAEEAMSWIDAIPPALLAAELQAFAGAEDLRPKLGAIRVPTVLRVGEQDGRAPAPLSEEMARLIPGARAEIVAGAGHLLLYEDAERTIASVVEALGQA